MKKILFSLLIISSIIACGDDDAAPVLTITSPTSFNINPGDIITLSGSATDDVELVNVLVESDGLGLSETIQGSALEANPNFEFAISTDMATPAGDYTITVTANDNNDQASSEEIAVTVN